MLGAIASVIENALNLCTLSNSSKVNKANRKAAPSVPVSIGLIIISVEAVNASRKGKRVSPSKGITAVRATNIQVVLDLKILFVSTRR